MKLSLLILLSLSLLPAAEDKKPVIEKKATAPPTDETLNYTINWPTGLSLGEAKLRTQRVKTEDQDQWKTEFTLDASVPGFAVLENMNSTASPEFCSVELQKKFTHGKKKSEETTTFDAQKGVATRETKGGGKSDLSILQCAKDAGAYLGYLRRELSQGRLPPHQTVYFGAPYRVSVQFAGTQNMVLGDKRIETDRLIATLKGEKADLTFEMFFTKDAARTPVLVKVPLQLATFSMELVP